MLPVRDCMAQPTCINLSLPCIRSCVRVSCGVQSTELRRPHWIPSLTQAAMCDTQACYKQSPSSLLLLRFEVVNILSKGDNSWKGLRGRMDTSTLKSYLPPLPNSSEKDKTLVCICGPNPFTAGISKYVCVCVRAYSVALVLPWQHIQYTSVT